MATPMLSILSLYAYDNTIFDNLVLPEGIDHQTIIDKICFDNAELSLIYTDPVAVKQLIKNWSMVQNPNWARIAEALSAEYSPIENYDRYEDFSDTGTNTTEQSTGTTRSVAGWNNDSSLTPSEGVTSEGSGSAVSSNHRTGHLHGNIGVTTAQQMITEEVKLRSSITLADVISSSFRKHFCIMIY